MYRLWVAAGVVAGCGRFHFDPIASNDGDGAAAEVCNGIDDNLDGIIDENCPCTPFAFEIDADDVTGLVWVGDHYLAVITSGGNVEVRPVANDGTYGASLGILPFVNGLRAPAIAWNGTKLAVAVNSGGMAVAAMFDPQSGSVTTFMLGAADEQLVVRRGSHFVFAFHSGSSYRIREIDEDGATVMDSPPLTLADLQLWSFAAGPQGYLLVTKENSFGATTLGLDGTVTRTRQDFGLTGVFSMNSVASAGGYAVSAMVGGVAVTFLDTTGLILDKAFVPTTFAQPQEGTVVAVADRYRVLVETSGASTFDWALFDYSFDGVPLGGDHLLGYSFAATSFGRLKGTASAQRIGATALYLTPSAKVALVQRCE